MEERHNFLFAIIIIIGISFIGIIASSYYFQINKSQKRVIALYEAMKLEELQKNAQLSAKNKRKKELKKITDLTANKDENIKNIDKNNNKKITASNPKILNKKNKDKNKKNTVVLANKKKTSIKEYNNKQKKDSQNCNKSKHFCPIAPQGKSKNKESKKSSINPHIKPKAEQANLPIINESKYSYYKEPELRQQNYYYEETKPTTSKQSMQNIKEIPEQKSEPPVPTNRELK